MAELFKVSAAGISEGLYGPNTGYRRFEIAKKSGGVRLIESPEGMHRIIQGKLAPILIETYRPSRHAHGFIDDRSIVSNARVHVGKALVVNIDLLDFFHSISFRRVRGIFLSRPFALKWQVANILAHACCCDGRLPAGGITSPTISNIVLASLDRRFSSLAIRCGGVYSRYADDLTMSFDRKSRELPGIIAHDESGLPRIGSQALEIIQSEGFLPNADKFRVSSGFGRKIVTGLVVNTKVNIQRRWLKKLDATIHAMGKFGVAQVAERLIPDLPVAISEKMLLRRIHGRVAFLHMVRGKGDWIGAEIAAKFNAISKRHDLKVPDVEVITEKNRGQRSVLILTTDNSNYTDRDNWNGQGSAIVLESGLLLTAAHVVLVGKKSYPYIYVREASTPGEIHECSMLKYDIAERVNSFETVSSRVQCSFATSLGV